MTSSERHLKGQRWDYNKPRYKNNNDVFLERGLFSVVLISHGRPEITRKCVMSTLDCLRLYPGEVEWIFIENGDCNATYEFFQGLKLERKVIVRQRNYGINEALNQGWAISRGEYCMIHENDWETTKIVDFLTPAKQIFEEKLNVGIIQLRDPFDPHENHGRGKPMYNPWSCTPQQLEAAGLKVQKEQTSTGHGYLTCKYPNGFNNNPVIIRKEVYRACGPYPEAEVGFDPRHGETEYQQRVDKLGCEIAYIGMPMYWHMGRVQTQAN